MSNQVLICTNCPKAIDRESAEIHILQNGTIKTVYYSAFGGIYRDYFKSVRGAKASLSRYMKVKTEWETALFPSQSKS